MSIELHIERLVIDAAVLGSERAADVQASIERELARQLGRPGAAEALRDLGTVSRLPLALLPTPGHAHRALGLRIAATVGESMGMPLTFASAERGHEARTRP